MMYKPGDWVIRDNIRTTDDHAPGMKATLLERTQIGDEIDMWLVLREDGEQEEWSTNAFRKAWGAESLREGDRVNNVALGEGVILTEKEAGYPTISEMAGTAYVQFDDELSLVTSEGRPITYSREWVALDKLTKVEPVPEEETPKTLEQQFRTIISDGIREFQENGGVVGTLADSGMYVRDKFINSLAEQLAEVASAIPKEEQVEEEKWWRCEGRNDNPFVGVDSGDAELPEEAYDEERRARDTYVANPPQPEKTLRDRLDELMGTQLGEGGLNDVLDVFREHFNSKRKEIEYAFECYRNGYNPADPVWEAGFIETLLFGDEP